MRNWCRILIWLLCMTRDSRCLLHTFSSSVQLTKENYCFRSVELDRWLSSKLKKSTKIFLTNWIYLVLVQSSYLLAFLQFQNGQQSLSFDVRDLSCVPCDVTFCFEITCGCRSWLKNVSSLSALPSQRSLRSLKLFPAHNVILLSEDPNMTVVKGSL